MSKKDVEGKNVKNGPKMPWVGSEERSVNEEYDKNNFEGPLPKVRGYRG